MAIARILVDGYSLLHTWKDLVPGEPRHSARAREALIHVLTQYADSISAPVTLFFDGAGAPKNTPDSISPDSLEIVFKDSLWGAAIGGVGGLAAWALQDKDGEDKVFPKYVSRYAAIGVFLGMGYGIFDANQGGDVFVSGTPSRSLIDYNPRGNLIIVRPSQFLPRLDFIGNQGRLSLKLLTASF